MKHIFTSLRAKLLVMFIILASVPLIIVGIVSYQKSYHTLSDNSKASTMLVADQLVRDIDSLFLDTQKLLELGSNPSVLYFLSSQTETYAEAKEIVQTLDTYRSTYQYESVLNIQMVNLYGKGISERRGVFQLGHNPLRNPHFTYLSQHPDEILIIPPDEASSFDRLDTFTYSSNNVISIISPIKQRVTHEVIGFIVIDLDDRMIEQFYNKLAIGHTGFFYVADSSGKPIFWPQPRIYDIPSNNELLYNITATRGSFTLDIQKQTQFIVYSTSEMTGWTIVGIAPLKEVIADAIEIRILILASVGLSTLFAISLYVSLTHRIIRPLQVLKNKMRRAADGYLEAKVKSSGNDEIADLSDSFNTMLENIKLLLEKNKNEQEQVKKAELRTLQSQINPHFLYNTLDSIIWMAEGGKNENVIKLVTAMSKFFRISLNKGKDWVSIKTELEHAKSYLTIQQMRYYDILTYEIDVAEELYPYPILAMTLQPLIENALYHGIKNKRGLGKISITGQFENDQYILLHVEDNGIGILPERLQELQDNLQAYREGAVPNHEVLEQQVQEHNGGFGLFNVHQRLRLYFGEPCGLMLESVYGEGTTISVRIPRK